MPNDIDPTQFPEYYNYQPKTKQSIYKRMLQALMAQTQPQMFDGMQGQQQAQAQPYNKLQTYQDLGTMIGSGLKQIF